MAPFFDEWVRSSSNEVSRETLFSPWCLSATFGSWFGMAIPLNFSLRVGEVELAAPPKLGVLSMVVDAASKRREDRDVLFLPIAINYEQIAEASSYRNELQGAKKERESVGQIVKARRVLKKRFGRVFLRVVNPFLARSSSVNSRSHRYCSPISERSHRPVGRAIGVRNRSAIIGPPRDCLDGLIGAIHIWCSGGPSARSRQAI